MKASIEISMYPLVPEYEQPILQFIERLHQYSELTIQTNTMSTQIFGDYDQMMMIVNKEMKQSFIENKATVMVMKVIGMDLNPSN